MKNRTDNMEDFFQMAFNDEEKLNQAAGWNEPSDVVWENIQSGLQEERRFSLVLLKWPWSAIAASYLLFMSGYSFFQSNTKDDLVNSVVKTEQQISEELVKNPIVQRTDDFSRREENMAKQSALKLGLIPSTEGKIVHNFGRHETKPILVSSLETRNIDHNVYALPIETIDRNSVATRTVDRPTVSIPTINSSLATNANNEQFVISNLVLPKQKKSKKYLAANYGSMVEKLGSNPVEYTSNQLTHGNTFGIQLGQENAKGWAIETGVQYTKMGERVVQNSDEDQFEIAATNYLDIPLTAKKSWEKGKLSVNVKTGLVNRFEINQVAQSNKEPIKDNQLQAHKYLPSVVAGVGLAYAIQPKLSLFVESAVSKGIKPVIDVEGMELTAENLMVQVGVRYEL